MKNHRAAAAALLAAALLAPVLPAGPALAAEPAPGYEVVPVPGVESQPNDVNELGQVVGYRTAEEGARRTAWLWEDGVFTDLPDLPGADPAGSWESGSWGNSGARVNEQGDVLGLTTGPHGGHMVIWTRGGEIIDLGAPLTEGVYPAGFNTSRQVLLRTRNAGQAWVWQDGDYRPIGNFGGGVVSATALNERGQAVGEAGHSTPGYSTVFLWEDGRKTSLGVGEPLLNDAGDVAVIRRGQGTTLYRSSGEVTQIPSRAWAINDLGHLIVQRNPSTAAIWRDGTYSDLQVEPEFVEYWTSLNNHDDVLARGAVPETVENDHDRKPLLWPGGEGAPFELSVPDFDATVLRMVEMNDQGVVIGFGGWTSQGYIWVPRSELPPLAPLAETVTDLVDAGGIVASTGRTLLALAREAEAERASGDQGAAQTLLAELSRTLDGSGLSKVDAASGRALRDQLGAWLPEQGPLDALRGEVRVLLEEGLLPASTGRRLIEAVPSAYTAGSLDAFSDHLASRKVGADSRTRLQARLAAVLDGTGR